jgi:hypothetical protein
MNLHRQTPRLVGRALVTAAIALIAPGLHGCGSDSPTAPETLPQTLETMQAAVNFVTNGQVLIPSSCGGTPAVNCPGGTAGSPVYLTMTQTASTVAFVPGADRYDFSVNLAAVSATGIPITIPLVGECTLNINTAPGTSPTMTITGNARFDSQTLDGPIDRISFNNISVTNLESADVAITGSLGCALADLGISFFIDTLTATFAENLVVGLCAAPGPALLRPCPEQP